VGPVDLPYLAGLSTKSDLRMEADKRASAHAHRVRHPNERRREPPPSTSTFLSFPFLSCHSHPRSQKLSHSIPNILTPPFPSHFSTPKPAPDAVRHYGLLKFLRRAGYASSLRVPGGPHALLRPGRTRRAADDMRRVSRAHLHSSRGVRRTSLGARGVLGGVQRARPRPGAPRLARG
jgi:hypothetical protein